MRSEDGSIIHECLNGESEAFGLLVDKYKEGIYAFVYGKLRDFHDAQDVTQEVFLQAYRDLRSLRRWESFVFWLYRIASTRCKLWTRSQSRRVDQDFIEDQAPKAIDIPSLASYRRDQLSESLREALDSLPEIYREVLMLYYFGGMSIKDIARAVGASPTAIGKRLSRARSQLKEEMVTMTGAAFEGQRLPTGFTFRIVEAVKRIKINPMPRMAGLPWGLSAAVGIIVAVLSLNPQMSIPIDMVIPNGSPLPAETKVLRTGEIPVDILKTSEISVISSKQANGDGGEPQFRDPQNAFFLAPHNEGGTWTKKAQMPTSRRSLCTSVVDGILYAIGGYNGIRWGVTSVEAYDPVKNRWTTKADMPTARHALSASAVDGIIYAIGGGEWDNVLSTTEAYDPTKDKWMEKADMLAPRTYLSTSVVDGKIYAIGGLEEWELALGVSTVEEYDPTANIWTEKANMPTPRVFLSTSVVDGKIYVIGGSSGLWGRTLATVEEYDPATDTWKRKSDMPTPRLSLSASAVNGKIYAIGGRGLNGAVLSTVEVYDPATDKWTTKTDMPTARMHLSTSSLNGKIYAIGGSPGLHEGSPPFAEGITEEYDPGFVSVSVKKKLPTKWGEVKSE